MSKRVDEILDVLKLAFIMRAATTENGASLPVADIRHHAVSFVAKGRGIDSTTVSDKFRRQLQPQLVGTTAFDAAVAEWLYRGSRSLENALQLHTVSDEDRTNIQSFFAKYKPSVRPLAPAN